MSKGWVCPECGLDYDTVSPKDAIAAVRSYPRRYGELLKSLDDGDDPDSVIRRRPDATTWSALEYTAHVADAFESMAPEIRRIVVEDEPTFGADFDPDERVTAGSYNAADRDDVLARVRTAADGLVAVLEEVGSDQWGRIGHYSYGDRDTLAITRNAVHEGSHHLRDVEKVLRAVR